MPLHINDLSGLKHSGKQIIASLRNKVIELQVQNSVLEAKLRQMEGCRLEGKWLLNGSEVENKEYYSIQNNTEIETSLTEARTMLDSEEESEGTNHTLEENTKTDEKKPDT